MKTNDSNKRGLGAQPSAGALSSTKSKIAPKQFHQPIDKHLPQPSELESLGSAICDVHAAIKKSGFELLLGAGKCGLLLLAAKDALKHGEFEPWVEGRGFGFSKVTRCKYMRLAERLYDLGKSKPGLLLTKTMGSDGWEFKFNEPELQANLAQACSGHTLSELYVQWDITKSGETVGEGAKEPSSTSNSPDRVFGRLIGMVKHMPDIFLQLQPEKRSQLVAQLEILLQQLRATPPTANQ